MRVAYDTTLRARLAGELHSLTIIDRYNLVDDAWNEVVAGRLGAADFLTFVDGFTNERELAVWQAIAAGLRGVGRLIDLDSATHARFRQRVAALVRPVLDDVQWKPAKGDDDLRAKLRGLLLSLLATLADDHEAQGYCRDLLDHGTTDPELLSAATLAVAASGTDADFDRFVEGFRNAATPQDMLRCLYALAEFPEQRHVERAVEFAFSGEVKTQNAPFLIHRCIANRAHGNVAWQMLRRRWTEANDRFPSNTIVRMIDPVKLLNTDNVSADVQAFFSEHPIPQGATTLDQVLERQRVNVAVRAREHDMLTNALVD